MSTEPTYTVELTEQEMQMVANGIAAFYNVMNREKQVIDARQTAVISRAMEKFKLAVNGKPKAPIIQLHHH